jgi:hypothetical protein
VRRDGDPVRRDGDPVRREGDPLTAQRATSAFRNVFATLKTGLRGGGVGRVYVTGVTPVAGNDFTGGFNVADDLSTHPAFATLFGFTEAEVRQVLERAQPSGATLSVDDALALLRREFNGYRFAPSSKAVYNSTQVLYFLQHYAGFGCAPRAGQLTDKNTKPSESTLSLITRHPQAWLLMNELVSKADVGRPVSGDLQPSVGIASILEGKPNTNDLLSYLYYMGAVTYAPDGGFVIPNATARREYFEEMKKRVEYAMRDEAAVQRAICALADGDLAPLLAHLAKTVWSKQDGNDVDNEREQAFKAQLMTFLALAQAIRGVGDTKCRGIVQSELTVICPSKQRELPLDLIYAVPEEGTLVHMELKYATMRSLERWANVYPWKELNKGSRELARMGDADLLKVTYSDRSFERKDGGRTTIGDQWDFVRQQARTARAALLHANNQAALRERLGFAPRRVVSFAAFRMGLERVLCETVV